MIVFHNPGLIDLDAIRLMGASVKLPDSFGRFGTGFKYGLATVLRGGAICAKIKRKGGEVIVELEEFASRAEAAAREIELIALYGRKDLGQGTLANMTNGGEFGVPGATFNKGRRWSEERKQRQREIMKGNTLRLGKKMPEGYAEKKSAEMKGNAFRKGKPHDAASIEKIKAYRPTAEQIDKMRENISKRKRQKGRFI